MAAPESRDLLNEYGDARFGDEWWPTNARAWIGEGRARTLEGLLLGRASDPDEAISLMNSYGEAKFAERWRPHDAEKALGPDAASELASLLSGTAELRPS